MKQSVKRSNAVLIVSVLTLATAPAAHAQSADLVLCDRIAADPADPDKPADVKGAVSYTHLTLPTILRV